LNGLGELVRILERRVAEGVTAEADLQKIETERVRVDTDAALARLRTARELTTLAALVGWSPVPPADALERPAPVVPAAADIDALVAAALARRPDVQLAAARLDTARQSLRFEQARSMPDLNVTGGLKRTGGYDTGLVALLVPVPLFDRNRAAVVLAQGGVDAAALELEQTRRLATADARAALATAIELARRSADASPRLLEPATVVRTAARSAFESGAGDLLRLVDAERVYADSRMVVNDLSIDALLAALEARLALAEEMLP
jgi:cobalt-zinc-cadmium efflux system outer membrane protein